MAKTSTGDFRRAWEGAGNEGEVLEKFALQFKNIEDAVAAVINYVGMQAVDGTENINATAASHTLHLSGRIS